MPKNISVFVTACWMTLVLLTYQPLAAEILANDGHTLACDADELVEAPQMAEIRLGEATPGTLRLDTALDNPSNEKLEFSATIQVASADFLSVNDLVEFGFLVPRDHLPLTFELEERLNDGLFNVDIEVQWRLANEADGLIQTTSASSWFEVRDGQASLLDGDQTLARFAGQLGDSEVGRKMAITAVPALRADVLATCEDSAVCQALPKLPLFADLGPGELPKRLHLTDHRPPSVKPGTNKSETPKPCRFFPPGAGQIGLSGQLVARETRSQHSNAVGSRVASPPARQAWIPGSRPVDEIYRVTFGHAVVQLTAFGIEREAGRPQLVHLGEVEANDQGCWQMVLDEPLADRFLPGLEPIVWPTVVFWHPDKHAAVLGSAGRPLPARDHGTTDSAYAVGGRATFSPYATALITDAEPIGNGSIHFGHLTVNPAGSTSQAWHDRMTAIHLTQTLMHVRMDELDDQAALAGSPAQGAINDIVWQPEPWVGADFTEIVGRYSNSTFPAKPCHRYNGQSWESQSNYAFSNSDFCMLPASTNHGTGHEIGHVVFKRAVKWKGHDPDEVSALADRITLAAGLAPAGSTRDALVELEERVRTRLLPANPWKHLSVRRMSEDLPFCKCCDLDWQFDSMVRVDPSLSARSKPGWTAGQLNEIWPSFFSTVVHWEPQATAAFYARPTRLLEGFVVDTSNPGVGPVQYNGGERCFGPPADLDLGRRNEVTARNIGNVLAGLWDLYDSTNEGLFTTDPSSGGDDPAEVPFAEMLLGLASTPLAPPLGANLLDEQAWNGTLYEWSAHPVTVCSLDQPAWNCVDPIGIVDDALGSVQFDPTRSFHRLLAAAACTSQVEQQCSMVAPPGAMPNQVWRRCGDGDAYNMRDHVANLVAVASAPSPDLWRSGIQHNCMTALDPN